MTDLRELRERIASLSGPDREIDWILANDLGGAGAIDDPLPFTASIDAVLGLAARAGKDWRQCLGRALGMMTADIGYGTAELLAKYILLAMLEEPFISQTTEAAG